MDLSLPLSIRKHRFLRSKSLNEAIIDNLELIISTPVGECVIDPDFGFILNNFRFEIFNEEYGTIYNSKALESDIDAYYNEKLSGTSKNLDTYAAELKSAIENYEKRLKKVSVSLNYVRLDRKIYISILGFRTIDDVEFNYQTSLNTWK
mgnify:FL=1